jgi:hypothetical protein
VEAASAERDAPWPLRAAGRCRGAVVIRATERLYMTMHYTVSDARLGSVGTFIGHAAMRFELVRFFAGNASRETRLKLL